MNTATLNSPRTPWYRQPWPWILMAGPSTVVIAGIFTAWLAFTHADPVISDDYYRQGLAAPQTIASSNYATALGLRADLQFSGDQLQLKLNSIAPDMRLPEQINLTLSHPTRAGLDQSVALKREGNEYHGILRLPQSGHWLVLIEDDQKSWRLLGKTILPATQISIGRASEQPAG